MLKVIISNADFPWSYLKKLRLENGKIEEDIREKLRQLLMKKEKLSERKQNNTGKQLQSETKEHKRKRIGKKLKKRMAAKVSNKNQEQRNIFLK